MAAVVTVIVYALAFWFLASIALVRARRDGSRFNLWHMASFGGLGLAASVVTGLRTMSFSGTIAGATVAISAASDLSTGLIYNAVVGAAFAGLAAMSLLNGHVLEMLAGTATALGIPLALHLISRGRGLGLGDVKLFAMAGAAYGVAGALVVIGLAFVAGGIHAVVVLATGRARLTSSLAFAPFIAIGAFGAACAGFGL